jgi:uncharacterized protein (DUF488 family)
MRSEIPAAGAPIPAGSAVWTVGYEGRTVESLIDLLRTTPVGRVIDVRDRPVSLAPGYSRGPLKGRLEAAGLLYREMPELGCTFEARRALWNSGDVERFRAEYAAKLATVPEAIERLARDAAERPSALLCLEREPARCHRGQLAERLADRGFLVHHL